jgi:hypothetical protein
MRCAARGAVDSSVVTAVISAAAGLATATIGALVKGAVNRRADVNEDLRAKRQRQQIIAIYRRQLRRRHVAEAAAERVSAAHRRVPTIPVARPGGA